ncbi:MAG TPA: PAS domain S-box protein [Pirellulales bacterium]
MAGPTMRSRSSHYAIAALAVAAATLIRFLLDPLVGDRFLLPTYFAAIGFAAWYAGVRVAIFAAILSYLAADYFFIPPDAALPLTHWDETTVNAFVAFIVVTATILILTELLNRANRRAIGDRERFRVTLSSIGDAVIATGPGERITFMNGIATALTGWQADEAIGRPLKEVFHIIQEKTRRPVENPCAKVIQTGAIVGLANHTVLIAKDGTERPIDDSAAPIFDDHGKVQGVILVFRDATKQRQAEEALQKLADIVEYSDDAIISKRIDGTITSWNAAAERLYGYTAAEAIGQHISLIVPADYRAELQEIMQRLSAGERIEHWDTVRQRKDGSLVEVSLRISPIKNAEGEVVGASKVARDISARRKEENAVEFLADSGQKLAALVDERSVQDLIASLPVPYFADWCIVYRLIDDGQIEPAAYYHRDPDNSAALHELIAAIPLSWDSMASAANALRKDASHLVADIPRSHLNTFSAKPAVGALFDKLRPRSVISVPMRARDHILGVITFVRSDGREAYHDADCRFAENIAGRAAIAIDNAQLYQSVQQAVGQRDEFLAMLAHELRNPLAAIRYATDLARMPAQEYNPHLFDIVERQLGNFSRLIDDLLDVSRVSQNKISLQLEDSDAKIIASRALETARPVLLLKGHQITVELTDEELPIHVDAVRTEQIVVNLLTNAAKYTPDGGHVCLRVQADRECAVTSVSDSGIGIAPEVLPRVFDLFAQADRTIDRTEGGLGIGLTVARRLAEMQGGVLSAASKGLGKGSEFTLRLRLTTPKPSSAVAANRAQATSHQLRILVVDDNRDTATTASLLLKASKHEVREAYEGYAALETFKAFKPDVALLDLGLPGLNGFEVAQKLREAGFSREILIAVSGYGQPEDRRRSQEAGFNYHLIKPVHHADLIKILNTIVPGIRDES